MASDAIRRTDIAVLRCDNAEADEVYREAYWMVRSRRSRRMSYAVFYRSRKVAWVQCADPFGTKLAGPLQCFDVNDAVELCRGFFIDEAPANTESCAIGKVLRLLPNDWHRTFGNVKKLAVVYQDLDAGQRGVVYRALGFTPYARCVRARHFSQPKRGNSRGNKILWARPLRRIGGLHYRVCMPPSDLAHDQQAADDGRFGVIEHPCYTIEVGSSAADGTLSLRDVREQDTGFDPARRVGSLEVT